MKASRQTVVLSVIFALAGCTLTQPHIRNNPLLPGGLGRSGQIMLSNQCRVEMIIPSRPLGEQTLNEVVWNVADAQSIDDEVRRGLEANGLRVGVITGKLPDALQQVLDAPPPNRVDPATVILPDGDNTLIDLGSAQAEVTLLVNREGSAAGKRYKDAKGHLRLAARREGDQAVVIRIMPEIHHGPVRQSWSTASGGGAFAPQQLVPHTGQTEETYRELAISLPLMPGQVAVVGALPERRGSLGHFLFTARQPNSDRLDQKLLLVRATRSDDGSGADRNTPPILPSGLLPFEPEVISDEVSEASSQSRIP